MSSSFLIKSIVLIIFIVLTNPISSSTIARASHKAGVPLVKESVIDVCKDNVREEEA